MYLLGVTGAIGVHLLSVIGVVSQLGLDPEVAPRPKLQPKLRP
jgi:hypothetical protein